MRVIIYIVLIALSLLVPITRLDISKLEPVEAVAITVVDDRIHLETDTGSKGVGATVKAAVTDLKENAPMVIYLDTARYLLVGEGAGTYVTALKEHLKRAVITAEYRGGEVRKEAIYLASHQSSKKPK